MNIVQGQIKLCVHNPPKAKKKIKKKKINKKKKKKINKKELEDAKGLIRFHKSKTKRTTGQTSIYKTCI